MLVLVRVEVLGWKIAFAFVWHRHTVPRLDKFASAAQGFK